jgi:hypothetical protein
MTVPISNVPRRVVLAASGTGPYSFNFEILAQTDIAVYKDDELLVLTTDYTVTINTNGTGFVTLTATPVDATQIAIVGDRAISRFTDFVTGGDLFANSLNNELDSLTIFAQQNSEGLARALLAPPNDPTTIDMTLPSQADRASKYLAFDDFGDPVAVPTPEGFTEAIDALNQNVILSVANGSINCNEGYYFKTNVSANTTFSFNSVPTDVAYAMTVEVAYTAGTITWPTAVRWENNSSAPTLLANTSSLFSFVTSTNGTRWFGSALTGYNLT